MAVFPTVPITELFQLKQGTYLKPAEMADAASEDFPYRVYGANGVIGYSNRKRYSDRTTLISCRGANCGVVHYTTRDVWISNNSIACVPRQEIDATFYYYVCLSTNFGDVITGAAQPQITITNLSAKRLIHPPLPVQQWVANILSAYDELAENSQRRIEILKEMARALYREWFVHFRFPDHEKVKRVASSVGDIPRGWEVKTIAESFEISGGGTPSRKEARYWDEGTIQWFAPSDLTAVETMFMDDSPEHITDLGLAESSARLFPAFSVMLTSRATIGAIAINTHEACTNQGFITCLPNERVPLYFLFHWLTENVPQFERLASGATFKEISRGVFKTIAFLHPDTALVRHFESTVEPMAKQMLALQRQIQNLRRTRDLLLPRLLSGQVNLSEPRHRN